MSTATMPTRWAASRESANPVLDVVVPVHNEERDLEPCLRRLHEVTR
jgi:hypothetical protein